MTTAGTVGTGCETELLHVSSSVYCSCVLCLLFNAVSEGSGREPQVRAPPVHHGVSHSSGRGQELRSEGGPAPVAVKVGQCL